jgi:hypothetical protein
MRGIQEETHDALTLIRHTRLEDVAALSSIERLLELVQLVRPKLVELILVFGLSGRFGEAYTADTPHKRAQRSTSGARPVRDTMRDA